MSVQQQSHITIYKGTQITCCMSSICILYTKYSKLKIEGNLKLFNYSSSGIARLLIILQLMNMLNVFHNFITGRLPYFCLPTDL